MVRAHYLKRHERELGLKHRGLQVDDLGFPKYEWDPRLREEEDADYKTEEDAD